MAGQPIAIRPRAADRPIPYALTDSPARYAAWLTGVLAAHASPQTPRPPPEEERP